jgi:xylulokinase
MSLYIGLDASTQSLSAVVVETDARGRARRVIHQHTLAFDEALPQYGTRHGVLPSSDPLVAESPPLMWAEALDEMMAHLAAAGIDLAAVRAVSGSAQQHGSVYLADGAGAVLASLDPGAPLASQLGRVLSRPASPIWMDSSTADDCAALADAVGGPAALAALTGSRAFERFTGPQIRKFARTSPDAYARTERIHLVSSFMTSLLAGGHAPIEPGDGSGMNLMHLATGRWAPEALAATAPDLASRLPPIVPSHTVVGTLAPYWQQRYGWPGRVRVAAWSGDNPCSLVGVGLVRERRVAVSLGTSDTVFGFMAAPRIDTSGTGHVFGAPTGGFMGLTCFKNGSLARERVRDAHRLDWAGFSRALDETPPGNGGRLMLPWFEPEITPPVLAPQVFRRGYDGRDAATDVRAVVEGQMLAMARHSTWMGVEIDAIRATGGAAANTALLQVMADVFNAEVSRLEVGNSAALGAALRAVHADQVADGLNPSWDEIVNDLTEPDASSRMRPRPEAVRVYQALREAHAAFEAEALAAVRRN